MDKERLDVYLVKHHYVDTRARARSFIHGEREVYVNNQLITKPAFLVTETDQVVLVQTKATEFVSRAGYKLAEAISYWHLDLRDLICLDIGASTGGFSECCLINGAKKVVAVDVGHDQLAFRLQNDPRIKQLDNLNFRYVTRESIPEAIDFYCCDVSFISLEHIVPSLSALNLQPTSFGVFLIKPQFETTKEKIKNGRAMDQDLHFEVISKVLKIFQDNHFFVQGLIPSPMKGNKKHNLEYLLLVSANQTMTGIETQSLAEENIKKIIKQAWTLL